MPSDDFPVTGSPEYYIRDVDISFDPELGETVMGNVSVEMKMSKPELDHESGVFTCNCDLFIDLSAQQTDVLDADGRPTGPEDFERRDYGDIEIDALVRVGGDWESEDEMEYWTGRVSEQIDKWKEDGYEAISPGMRFQIESEILSELLVPISQLLRTEFKGILPRVMFERSDSEDSNN